MLTEKIEEIKKAQGLQQLLIYLITIHKVKKISQIFNRECSIRVILNKSVFLIGIMRIRFMKRIVRMGKKFETRLNRQTKQAILAGTECIRDSQKEQAKQCIHWFLDRKFKQRNFSDKVQDATDRIIWMQRSAKLKIMMAKNKKWLGTVYGDEILIARGLHQMILVVHAARMNRRNHDLKAEYDHMDALRANRVPYDDEKVVEVNSY